jgi:hypothetical protein
MNAIRTGLETVAIACRVGLFSLVDAKGSTFNGFPSGACGVASDILGRIVWDTLQYEGDYVCGTGHPKLKDGATHAWFEVGDFIIDITYDQFQATGLSGWVFDHNDGWHAQFHSQERRQGFCMPFDWPAYPLDGYRAARVEAKKAGLICKPE